MLKEIQEAIVRYFANKERLDNEGYLELKQKHYKTEEDLENCQKEVAFWKSEATDYRKWATEWQEKFLQKTNEFDALAREYYLYNENKSLKNELAALKEGNV